MTHQLIAISAREDGDEVIVSFYRSSLSFLKKATEILLSNG